MARLTLLEDDPGVRAALVRALSELGHELDALASPVGAVDRILQWQPDVVILDLGLPDVDGTEVLRALRRARSVPVIVASARDADEDVIDALNLGADDYLVKPFSTDQLDARIRAVVRRAGNPDRAQHLRIGGLRIDGAARQVWLDGRSLSLTPKEFDLLAYLARHSPDVVPKQRLLAEVWKQPHPGNDKTVDVHLSWLRRKLGEARSAPGYLNTVRGVGVQLIEPRP